MTSSVSAQNMVIEEKATRYLMRSVEKEEERMNINILGYFLTSTSREAMPEIR